MLINEINSILKFDGNMGIILGSGLDHVINKLTNKIPINAPAAVSNIQ